MPKTLLSFRTHQAGFTFIELMVVIVIIGVLSIAGMVSFQRAGYSARNGKRVADVSTVQQALELYKSENSTYPIYPYVNDFNTLAQYYMAMNQDLVSASFLTQAINDPKYVSGQPLSTESRQYIYYSTTGRSYVICYFKEPGSLIFFVCQNSP